RFHRCRGERVRSGRPERGDARREPTARRLVELTREREAAERRVLPRDDRMLRRYADDRERDIAWRRVGCECDERARAAGERFGRRADEPLAPDFQLGDATLDQLSLLRAGTDDHGRRRTARDPLEQLKSVIAAPLAAAHRLGDDNDVGARAGGDIGRTRELGGEMLDGRGLRDIERLACRDVPALVDEDDGSRDVAAREQVRHGPAEFPCSVNRDRAHAVDYSIRMESIDGKVALVTGGSRGIGLAIASALVAEGVNVAITGRDASHLSTARRTIEGAGPGTIETLQADVRRFDEIDRAIGATVSRFGGLDFLINNAGIGIFTSVASMTPQQWSDVIDTNLTGVFNACHAAIPHLRSRGGGFIINISSLAGKNPFVDGAAYCASKSGLNAFSEALMQELR